MKKIFVATFAIILLIGLGYFFLTSKSKKENWYTFNKETTNTINSYPSTPKEKEQARLDDTVVAKTTKEERKPASIKPKKKPETSIGKRTWSLNADQKVPNKISFLNEPKKEWRELLGQDLMKFLRPRTKVFIKKEGSHTILKRNGGLHVEKVHVKMQSPEGRQYSYHAFVDSETGKVIQTWNQTIHEPMGKKPQSLRPSGHISPDGVTRY